MAGFGRFRNKPLVYTPPRAADAASVSAQPARWRWLRIILGALRRTCTVIGAVVLGLAALGLFSTISLLRHKAPDLPQNFVLTLTLEGGLPEKPHDAGLSNPFAKRKLSVFQTVDALARAEKDPRVKGLIVNLDGAGLSVAHIQELRAAIKRLRTAGKFAWVWAPSYGDMGTGLGTYYLASAFEQIWMQPLGTVSIAGIGMEIPYVRKTLDTIGVEPQFFQRKEYKTAFESFTQSSMSAQNREMMTAMIESIGGRILTESAADRRLDPARLRALIDRGLLLGQEALDAKLIDRLDYNDVLVKAARVALGMDSKGKDSFLVPLAEYREEAPRKERRSHTAPREQSIPVALVYISGTIVEGDAEASAAPMGLENETASATEIATALFQAGKDPDIAAIVVRIDSPGGSPVASETMRRALIAARENGKKIIVSMGTTAASGGYWVATPADRIFASPATLTGSIGVVGGKVSLAGLSEKLGVTWESVRWGRNADLWSFNAPFTESGAERINAMLDEVYNAFVARVAEGRKMTPEQVERVARGRVWTGEQAKAIGLVDALGGLDSALDYTARQLGLSDRSGLDIQILPKPRTPIEELLRALEQETVAAALQHSLARALLASLGERPAAGPAAWALDPAMLFAAPH